MTKRRCFSQTLCYGRGRFLLKRKRKRKTSRQKMLLPDEYGLTETAKERTRNW
ncbi:hypothetical protein HanPSC8_Chr08g0333121 [Helianthus annuus]|nr:hypothetical protein HanPSC8_Chr08g0333121 [Helianthus annuus]